MEPFYPAALWTVLQTFRSCFSKPTWPYFLGYIWALIEVKDICVKTKQG